VCILAVCAKTSAAAWAVEAVPIPEMTIVTDAVVAKADLNTQDNSQNTKNHFKIKINMPFLL